jgi:Cu(I)/Ag(I) efflux system membrane fusion protein
VKPGEPLAELYSPELVSAQQELLQALPGPEGATGAAALLPAVRERLRLWGLTVEQIAELERSRQVRDHITFYAPIGGIVVEKEAREGMYVEKGMRLFTVADLSQVWVVLDAYESDLAWLRTAQEVSFEAEAYPGETFHGTVAFIAPLVDPMTRTVKVRVNAANADGRLKPELFVRAVVRAPVAADGEDGGLPLVIPASAALLTGKRAVVYVAAPGAEGVFEGRDVTLGPKAGDSYVVRAGLSEGEPVVVKGAFKIDSSLQIQGRPSMMAPGGEGEEARGKAQAICPVMGGEIDREVFVDYQGQRVYFCCPGCREPFLKEPQKYLEKLKAEGVTLEAAPASAPESHAGHAP